MEFRSGIVVQSDATWLGPIHMGSPIHHHIFAWTALALTAGIMTFLIFGHYTRHLAVNGTLVPSEGLLSVTVPISGTIQKVMIRSGQEVQSGTPLMEIASNLDSPSVGLVSTIIEHSLADEQSILRHNLHAEDSVSRIQRRMLDDKLQDLHTEYAQMGTEITIQRRDIASTERVLQEFLSVKGRGLVSDPQLQQQQLTVYSAKSQLEDLESRRTALAQQISDSTHQIAELPLTTQNQENDIRSKLDSLRQDIAKTAGGHALILRAPSAGVISSLTVNPGQAVTAGSPVLSVMPAKDPLMAQLLVPSRAVGFIRAGSSVSLHYAAFSYRDFGAFHGTVRSISRSALTPDEIATLTQQRSTVPLYRVMVVLRQSTVMVNGHPSPLRAGMQLHAEITLNRLRLIQWVFEPLYGLGHDVFIDGYHKTTRVPSSASGTAHALPLAS